MKKILLVVGLSLLLILTGSGPVAAQGGDACPALVEQALASLDDLCLGLDRNTACYGHNRVDALFWTPQPDTVFSRPADRVALIDLQRVATTPLDLDASEWGLALLHVQASLPETLPGQAVTMLLMGDASLENAVTPEDVAAAVTPVEGHTTTAANVRSQPTTSANIVFSLPADSPLSLIGLNPARDWYQIALEGSGSAWIYADLVRVDNLMQLMALPVTYGVNRTPQYGPMQALYFTASLSAPDCRQAPNALVVQSPEQVEVTLNINALEIQLGSTAVFSLAQTSSGQPVMVATLLEGRLQTLVGGYPVSLVTPGRALALTLNDDGQVDNRSRLVHVPDEALLGDLVGAACQNAVLSGVLRPALNLAMCQTEVKVYVPPPPPTAVPATPAPPTPIGPEINFWVDRNQISLRECVTVSWSVENVQSVFYGQEGVTGEGSRQECPTVDTVYTLTVVTQAGERITRSLPVTVLGGYYVNFWADKLNLGYAECTQLHWDSAGISALYLNGQGVTGQGSTEVCPGGIVTYNLMAILPDNSQVGRSLTIYGTIG